MKIRKKPCPYCGKKLQAANKLKWRNNLARHLGNACPPYEREIIRMGLRMLEGVAILALTEMNPGFEFKRPEQFQKERQEIQELEALYKQDSVPSRTPGPPASTESAIQPKGSPKGSQ
jgi:hypothetical protein